MRSPALEIVDRRIHDRRITPADAVADKADSAGRRARHPARRHDHGPLIGAGHKAEARFGAFGSVSVSFV
ncbi:hypothetical protein [Streptomyces sp. CB02460]|uniref:hypothetical protein n=1 Tax=Streptomyces sp. CB02460 TaxID=1703941 RepID=UPI000959FC86|nr:hypothetical protein [Streptomyces sp. CB02460]OKJ73099.1 hypothetical protein AMK30_19370 [Streptomyces sp. CB02460]